MKLVSILTHIVFTPRYGSVAFVVALVVFTGAVWLPNVSVITAVLQSTASAWAKIQFITSLYGAIATNFTFISATYTILIALLFGVQVALLSYYVRTVRSSSTQLHKVGATSIGGLVSGVFGIGCAACGTFLLTSILTLFGVGGVVAYLPFGGEEFGIIGVLLLTYSIYILLQKINKPFVCPV